MTWEAVSNLTEGRLLHKLELIEPWNVPNSEQAHSLSRVDKEKGKMASLQGIREGIQAGIWTQRLLMLIPNLHLIIANWALTLIINIFTIR